MPTIAPKFSVSQSLFRGQQWHFSSIFILTGVKKLTKSDRNVCFSLLNMCYNIKKHNKLLKEWHSLVIFLIIKMIHMTFNISHLKPL